jgi:hypothetical protein
MSRGFELWIGVCAVVTAIAIVSFACAIKTGGVEFSQKPVLERSEGMVRQAFPPVKVGSFVSWLSVKILKMNDIIAKQFDRGGTNGTGIPACGGQRDESRRLLHLGIALLKMLATACLKGSKHTV